MTYNFNCLVKTEGPIQVTGSHMHCKSVKILKTTASARYRRYSRPPIGGDIWLSNYIITDDLE